jgi:hypothetical protein
MGQTDEDDLFSSPNKNAVKPTVGYKLELICVNLKAVL